MCSMVINSDGEMLYVLSENRIAYHGMYAIFIHSTQLYEFWDEWGFTKTNILIKVTE